MLPSTLTPLYGRPSSQLRRTEKDRKIVLYVIAADNGHETEKFALYQTYKPLREYCASRGFELQLVDTHKEADDYLDPKCWAEQPLEARGGHHLDTVCVSEIASKFTPHDWRFDAAHPSFTFEYIMHSRTLQFGVYHSGIVPRHHSR